MIRPEDIDVIVAQPHHIDYPLFRYNIQRFRKYFHRIFLTFTQNTMGISYYDFFVEYFPDVTFVRPQETQANEDWRSLAVRDVLNNYSKSKYVLFLEQDFFIKDERIFEVLYNDLESDTFFYIEGGRIHPAFAIVPRDLINKTAMDFSARPPMYDHFGLFFKQLTGFTNHRSLIDMGLIEREDFYHLASLTQNYYCFTHGEPLYKPNEFLAYNHFAQKIPLAQPQSFIALEENIERKFGKGDPETSGLRGFFPKETYA